MEDFREVKSILLTRFRIDKETEPELWACAQYDVADDTEVIISSSDSTEKILADIEPLIHPLYQ